MALVAQYRKAGVTGLPDASAFATPALAPTFQPGMPLGHVARVMNRCGARFSPQPPLVLAGFPTTTSAALPPGGGEVPHQDLAVICQR